MTSSVPEQLYFAFITTSFALADKGVRLLKNEAMGDLANDESLIFFGPTLRLRGNVLDKTRLVRRGRFQDSPRSLHIVVA